MGKNIVVLSGSPRKDGATDRLVNAFVEGAKSSGNATTCFRVADLKIGACLGCNHCFKEEGVCVQKDDMTPILDALRKADVLVLASPVYFFSVTAQIKSAIDRMYALLKEGSHVKQAALLITCGAESASAADPAVSMFRHISGYQKWQELGVVIAAGLAEPQDIEGRPELESAKKLGQGI